MTQITWTALPNGVDGQKAKVTLFVTLNVDTGDLNGQFSQNWPTVVAGLNNLTLTFDDSSEAQFKPDDTSILSPGLWTQIFPGSTKTSTPEVHEHHNRPKLSYPTRDVRKRLEEVYKDTAENFPTRLPRFDPEGFPGGEILDFVREIGEEISGFEADPVVPPGPAIAAFIAAPPKRGSHPAIGDQLDATGPFYRAYRFHRRSLDHIATPVPGGPGRPALPDVDFHQAIGMLGDHPALLRRLGLIIDGTVQLSKVPTGATARMRLKPPQTGAVTPWTHYTRTGSLFVLTPNPLTDSDLSLGMMKLGDTTRFEIHQLDIDGAALKLGHYAVTQNDLFTSGKSDDHPEAPNLRTAGIVVSRVERKSRLTDALKRSHDLQTKPTELEHLYADDLTRGYRIDVRKETDSTWRSLCQRHGVFLVGPTKQRVPAQGEVHDEGYVKATGVSSEADVQTSNDKPMYIHEALFSWDGWSQVVPSPGRTMKFEYDNVAAKKNPEVVDRVQNVPKTAFDVQTDFKAEPGTLPKLRFGETYRLRARAVDLAGNSLPLSAAADATQTSGPQPFLRYEPVPHPVLVLRNPLVEGESVENVVIRSKSGDAKISPQVFFSSNERHLAPPSTTLDLSIMHGVMDPFFNDPNKSFNIALRSEGTLLDQEIFDKNGKKKKVPGIQIINSPGVAPGTPAAFPATRGAGLAPGQYVIHANPNLLLPYLPDAFAAGVALKDDRKPSLQTTAVGLHKIAFSGNWPDVDPSKIVVQASKDAEPRVEVSGTTFVVKLPPATILPLRYSSVVPDGGLDKLAIWALMSASKRTELFQTGMDGQHWMITPNREVVFVHAVERPLRASKFKAIDIEPARAEGETFAKLKADIDCHFHSTGQVDIEASWSDPVDLLTNPGPTDEFHQGHVSSHRPQYDDTDFVVGGKLGLDENRPKHDFGDTKHHVVQYRPDATTRYREYFPPEVTSVRENILFPGESFELSIPSTARPKAPDVLYVIPTFRWDTQGGGGTPGNGHPPSDVTSSRVGRGLRVYLARPWFSSGEGELLAVVLPKNSAPSEAELKYVSEWGADPIWKNQGPKTELVATDFANAAVVADTVDLPIAEETGINVHAVAFDVEYHADRRVWAADIEFESASSYFPFVRLALARYQPDSIDGVHLSPIVKAEFTQLVNDRTATLQFDSSTIRVTVTGVATVNRLGQDINDVATSPGGSPPPAPPGFTFDPAAGAGRIVSVRIEERGPGNSDLEWTAVGGPVTLPSFSEVTPTGPNVLWTGDVPNPPRTPASFKRRLIIQEVEVYRTDKDNDVAEVLSVTAPDGGPVRGRVVYLDVIDLDKH